MIVEESSALVDAIDRSSPTPLYHQVKQALLSAIHAGEFRASEPLPTEKDLQQLLDVSRITVRRAMGELVAEGYVKRQSGRGTFVVPEKIKWSSSRLGYLRQDLAELGYEVSTKVLDSGLRPAPPHAALKLKIEEGAPIFFLQRLISVDGEPLLVTTGYHNYGPDINLTQEELEASSLFRLMDHYYGGYRAERTIEATMATDEEAKILKVKPKAPMLLTELLVESQDGVIRAFVKALYRGDRYKYRHTTRGGSLVGSLR